MTTIKNIAVNSERKAILFDFFVESEKDLPILLDIVSSKFLSTFCLNELFIDEEEYQEIFIELMKPMVKRIKFAEENRIIVRTDKGEEEEHVTMYINYNFK